MQRRRTLAAIMAAGSLAFPVACTPAGPVSPPAAAPSAPAASAIAPSPQAGETAAPLPGAPAGPSPTMPVSGRVLDEAGVGVAGATVVAKVLGTARFGNGSDALVTTTVAEGDGVGGYLLPDCPTGTAVTVTVTKPGWTTRSQVHVPVSLASPGANDVDFGGRKPAFALSDAPEITKVVVQGDNQGVDPATSISLHFSEPVEGGSFEKAMAVFAAGPATTGDAAVWRFASGGGLPVGYDTPSDTLTAPDKPIWDLRAFTAVWHENRQEVTLTFRGGYRLPADRNARIGYALALREPLRDLTGKTRSRLAFRTQAAEPGRNGFAFETKTDRTSPRVVGVTATDVGSSKAPAMPQDRIRITYSKPIVYQPLSLADGASSLPDAANAKSALNVANYRYIASAAVPEVFPFEAHPQVGVTLAGGNTTVEIAPNADNEMTRNNTVYVQINPQVTDPAGNPIDTGSQGNIGSGRLQ